MDLPEALGLHGEAAGAGLRFLPPAAACAACLARRGACRTMPRLRSMGLRSSANSMYEVKGGGGAAAASGACLAGREGLKDPCLGSQA